MSDNFKIEDVAPETLDTRTSYAKDEEKIEIVSIPTIQLPNYDYGRSQEQIDYWTQIRNKPENPLFWTWIDSDLYISAWQTKILTAWVYNYNSIIIESGGTLTTDDTSGDFIIKSMLSSRIDGTIDFSSKNVSFRTSTTISTLAWEILTVWATGQWGNWGNWWTFFWPQASWGSAQNWYGGGGWGWEWWLTSDNHQNWWVGTNWGEPGTGWASITNVYGSPTTTNWAGNNGTWLGSGGGWSFATYTFVGNLTAWGGWTTDPITWVGTNWVNAAVNTTSRYGSAGGGGWGGWRPGRNWLNIFLYLNWLSGSGSILSNWENWKHAWDGWNWAWYLWFGQSGWGGGGGGGWSPWAIGLFYSWVSSSLTITNNIGTWWTGWSWAHNWWNGSDWASSSKIVKDISQLF